ncbi:Thymocyte nuclear protein 1 [Kappamyces sp. JEL0829]|nr:Thymocyte nuclear protein 1 [Kappamyces sp. JEL0829]
MKGTAPQYWLIKAEPNSRVENGVDVKFSIDDLKNCPDGTDCWNGVRNYEARTILRDKMKEGDVCLFYHSNCKQPGIAGLATVVKEGYPDHTAFDASHPYFDRKSDPEAPTWFMVDVKFERKLARFISLKELQKYKTTALATMPLMNRGRLSAQPVDKPSFDFIMKLERETDGE